LQSFSKPNSWYCFIIGTWKGHLKASVVCNFSNNWFGCMSRPRSRDCQCWRGRSGNAI
jgi:hypothetical protein